ncbi:hypothetical protein DICA3_D09076 [Diutina catenulata]
MNLLSFIQGILPEAELQQYPIEFERFLTRVFIEPCDIDVWPQNYLVKGDQSYSELIDELVRLVRNDKTLEPWRNALGATQYNDVMYGRQYSAAVNVMLGIHWQRVWHLLGTQCFVSMVLNFKGLEQSSESKWFQLFGPTSTPFSGKDMIITSGKLMFRPNYRHKLHDPRVPSNYVYEVIRRDRRLHKKYGAIKRRMIRSREVAELQVGHSPTVESDSNISGFDLDTPAPDENRILKFQTPLKEVVAYVLLLLDKVVPFDAWGSRRQKSRAFSLISKFISTPNMRVSMNTITEILGTKRSLLEFFWWVLDQLVPYLVTRFFLGTDVKGQMIYFEHGVFEQMSGLFMNAYKKEFLEKLDPSTMRPEQGTENFYRYNFGHLRLIPKNSEFRLLCVPSRNEWGVEKPNTYNYAKYQMNYINPIRHVLKQKLENHYFGRLAPCHGLSHLADTLREWRMRPEVKSQLTQGAYFLRFDFAKCFDRLNRRKLLATIAGLFRDDPADHTFVVNNHYMQTWSKLQWCRPKSAVMNHSQIPSSLRRATASSKPLPSSKITIHKGKTTKITKRTILEFCWDAINNAFLLDYSGVAYRRTKGVFQGFPLSPLFCDIILSEMVVKEFPFLLRKPNVLVIRVVDDLLIISTSPTDVISAKQVVESNGLQEYGARINVVKSSERIDGEGPSKISFLGAKIDCYNLEIDEVVRPSLTHRSFRTAYAQLLYQYKRGVTNLEESLDWIFNSLSRHFGALLANDVFSPVDFFEFIAQLIQASGGIEEEIVSIQISRRIKGPLLTELRRTHNVGSLAIR